VPVVEWLREVLCIFKYPREDTLVRHVCHIADAVSTDVAVESGFGDSDAIHQTRTAHQCAASFALREVYPATSRSRGTTNLPVLLASQNFVDPLLLHHEGNSCGPFHGASFASGLLDDSFRCVAGVAWAAVGVAVVAWAAVGLGVASIIWAALGFGVASIIWAALGVASIIWAALGFGVASIIWAALGVANITWAALGFGVASRLGATYSSLRLETKSTQLRPHGLDSAAAFAFA